MYKPASSHKLNDSCVKLIIFKCSFFGNCFGSCFLLSELYFCRSFLFHNHRHVFLSNKQGKAIVSIM